MITPDNEFEPEAPVMKGLNKESMEYIRLNSQIFSIIRDFNDFNSESIQAWAFRLICDVYRKMEAMPGEQED